MSKPRTALPPRIARCVWSYDPSSLDVDQDRELIITQVLNYGDWEGIRWLHQTYPERLIKEVVAHPRRGLWLKQVLSFWCLMLGVRLSHRVKEQALFRLEPQGRRS